MALLIESNDVLVTSIHTSTDYECWILLWPNPNAKGKDSPEKKKTKITGLIPSKDSSAAASPPSSSPKGPKDDDNSNPLPTKTMFTTKDGKKWTYGIRRNQPVDKSDKDKWSMELGEARIKPEDGKERPLFYYFKVAFPWDYFPKSNLD